MALGFVGAWSMPIKSATSDRILGTFGTYFRESRRPSDREIEAVRNLAQAAARVIEHSTA
jgi:hypothetical protein